MDLYEMVFFFFIYGFLGWCTEVVYAALKHGGFVNRGFLNGPICPVYSFGVLLVILALEPISDHLPLLFLGSMLLTSALEFLTGWVLEQIFHARWWDYRENRFNLMGYICLEFSLLWGLAATFVVRIIHPLLLGLVDLIPHTLGLILLGILLATILFDLVATLIAIRHLQDRVKLISSLAGEIHGFSDRVGETISGTVLTVKEKADDEKAFYAPYQALCEQNEAEEKALAEAHRAAELEMLEQLREQAGRSARGSMLALEEKRNTLGQKIAEHKPYQLRILAAFPQLTMKEGQEALTALKEHHKSGKHK